MNMQQKNPVDSILLPLGNYDNSTWHPRGLLSVTIIQYLALIVQYSALSVSDILHKCHRFIAS